MPSKKDGQDDELPKGVVAIHELKNESGDGLAVEYQRCVDEIEAEHPGARITIEGSHAKGWLRLIVMAPTRAEERADKQAEKAAEVSDAKAEKRSKAEGSLAQGEAIGTSENFEDGEEGE